MIRRLLFLALCGGASLFATNCDARATDWQSNGGAQLGTQWPDPFLVVNPAGSVICTNSVAGANPNDYEVSGILGPTYGGTSYIHFLRASSASVQSGIGSYISVELTLPYYSDPNAIGLTQMTVNQAINGVVTNLSSSSVSLRGYNSIIRTIIWGTNLRVFIDGRDVLDMTVPFTSGKPGAGSNAGLAFYQNRCLRST